MPALAYVNGDFMPIEKAMVPIEDRGYQFGDAVYEFIVSYNGRLFCLEEHLARLENSMRGLAFPTISREEIKQSVLNLFERADISRAGIYIQISRGTAPRDHVFPASAPLQVIMTIREVTEKPAELRGKGAAAIMVEDFRWGRCDLKTVQLLPNVLAKQKAVEAGVFDAVFVSPQKIVREATSSNFFIVRGGALWTHPLTPHVLPGITRKVIIDLCREMSISVEETFFETDDVYSADEAFLTGTVTEVLPVVKIDARPIGNGRVGAITAKLYEELRRFAGA